MRIEFYSGTSPLTLLLYIVVLKFMKLDINGQNFGCFSISSGNFCSVRYPNRIHARQW